LKSDSSILKIEQNKQQLQTLLFVLQNRVEPTVISIVVDSFYTREIFIDTMKSSLQANRFFDVEFEGLSVNSLANEIKYHIRGFVLNSKPGEYIVNIFGLENSLYKFEKEKIVQSRLVSEINFERDILFREFPFSTIIWTDLHFRRILQKEALDLWSWLNYSFEFKSDWSRKSIQDILDKALKSSNWMIRDNNRKPSRILVNSLYSNKSNNRMKKSELINQKYLAAVHENKGEFRKAITIISDLILTVQHHFGDKEREELLFKLGTLHLKNSNLIDALENYSECILLQKKSMRENKLGYTYHQLGVVLSELHRWNDAIYSLKLALQLKQKNNTYNHSIGNTYYQLGLVFTNMRNFDDAIACLEKAIKKDKNCNNTKQIGNIYHQFGLIYTKLNEIEKALGYFFDALEWKKKTKDYFTIGITYHYIGAAYVELWKFDEARKYYLKAIISKESNKNYHSLGITYHGIGMSFKLQRHWSNAIRNFRESIKWKKKTAQYHSLGNTYHQIGALYESKGKINLAIIYFLKAFKSSLQYTNIDERALYLRSIQRSSNKVEKQKVYELLSTVFTAEDLKTMNLNRGFLFKEKGTLTTIKR